MKVTVDKLLLSTLFTETAPGSGVLTPDLSQLWDFTLAPSIDGKEIATQEQVAAAAQGLDPKVSCLAATSIDLATDTGTTWTYDNGAAGVGATLTSDTNGNYDIDGYAGLAVGDHVLIKDDGIWNGIYQVTQAGDGSNPMILTRSEDFDEDADINKGGYTFVYGGLSNAGTGWVVTTSGTVTVGTTPITLTLFLVTESTTASGGLTKTGYNIAMTDMAQNTIKGRITASPGTPEDLTAAQVRTIINVADGANNYVHPNHTGDVTSTGDQATVIGNNVVTNAKAADMNTNTIKGRITAGSGDPEDLIASQVRTIINVADGANNYVHPNHTGDVTSTGDQATVIANDVVTNAKLANMNENTFKARATAGAGDPEDLTAAQARTVLNVADGANNYVHPNHTGDVTSTGDAATVIANDVVTNAKLANMDQATIKGRQSGAGTGDPEDLTAAQAKTILDLAGSNTGDEVQATESVAGIAEVATQAETDAGTLDTHMVTPLKLAVNRTLQPIVTDATTAKNLALTDAGKTVRMNNASPNVVTILAEASVNFTVGTFIRIRQIGAGATSVTADTGVTLNGVSAGSGTLSGQWKEAYLHKVGTDEWEITGDIGAVA